MYRRRTGGFVNLQDTNNNKNMQIYIRNQRNVVVKPNQETFIPENEDKIVRIDKKRTTNKNINFQKFYINTPSNLELKLNLRPAKNLITTVGANFYRLDLKQEGCFNGAIVKSKKSDKIICVYRNTEQTFQGCFLNEKYKPIDTSFFDFEMRDTTDPRLIWTVENKLLLIYSHHFGNHTKEYIAGRIIMDADKEEFFLGDQFRISPENIGSRQKNWVPFLYEDKVHFISEINSQKIWKMNDFEDEAIELVSKAPWQSNWFMKEFFRGNTNPIRMKDGNFLNTFHTAQIIENTFFYDNGCYVFEGKPPFKVLRFPTRTYLPAEAATEPHYRKHGEILCNFPCGMIYDENKDKIIISYGDNDSAVKIMETDIENLLNTTEKV